MVIFSNMKYIFIALFLLLTPLSASAVWFNSSWDYKVKLEVVPARVGSSTAVTNFPVYVDLSHLPAGFHTNVKGDGCDIRVVKSDDTTETPFELVVYATSTDTGELYFKADTLATSTASSTYYIYYGNSGASCYAVSDPYGRNNVWTSYKAVYHFQHTSGSTTDSTGNSYTLTNTGSVAYSTTTGLFQTNITPPSGTNKFMGRTDNVGTTPTGAWSVSMWLKLPSETSVDRELFQNYIVGAGGAIYRGLYEYNSGTRRIRFFRIGSGATFLDITGNIADNTLKNIVYTYNGTNQALYLNNNTGVTGANTGTASVGSAEFNIGGGITNTSVNGPMDEVRVATTTLTSAWRTTEYNNMSSPSTFYWVGAQEAEPAGGSSPVDDSAFFN